MTMIKGTYVAFFFFFFDILFFKEEKNQKNQPPNKGKNAQKPTHKEVVLIIKVNNNTFMQWVLRKNGIPETNKAILK